MNFIYLPSIEEYINTIQICSVKYLSEGEILQIILSSNTLILLYDSDDINLLTNEIGI